MASFESVELQGIFKKYSKNIGIYTSDQFLILSKLINIYNDNQQNLTINQWHSFNRIVIPVDFHILQSNLLSIEDIISENPSMFFTLSSVAFEWLLSVQYKINILGAKIVSRFYHICNPTPFDEIKSLNLNKLVSVRGTIISIGELKQVLSYMEFICIDCKSIISEEFEDGRFSIPKKCSNSNCSSKHFNLIKTSGKGYLVQRIKIQELQYDLNENTIGKIPSTIEAEISDDLLNQFAVSDVVEISGIIKPEVYYSQINQNKSKGIFYSFIEVNSIFSIKNNLNYSLDSVKDKAFQNVLYLLNDRNVLPLLIKSFCPSIFGLEEIKLGFLLSIVGGSSKWGLNQSIIDKLKGEPLNTTLSRHDIHVLVVGDPGMGKSKLLKFAALCAPRSHYVCGKSITKAGLTSAIIKDSNTGETKLDAGALALSDLGICCIDEFDKMATDSTTLLEAMEQQTITIAKSGIYTSLQSRCGIIACANGEEGNYNQSKSLTENVKIPTNILSRFDLIYLLLDRQEQSKDLELAKHILNIQKRKKQSCLSIESSMPKDQISTTEQLNRITKKFKFVKELKEENSNNSNSSEREDTYSLYSSLAKEDSRRFSISKLLKDSCSSIPSCKLIPVDILKQYLIHVRSTIYPKLSNQAKDEIKIYYKELRSFYDGKELPITPRQLQALARIGEAIAKLQCRNIVTIEDARLAIKLYNEIFLDIASPKGEMKNQKHFGEIELINDVRGLSKVKQRLIFISKLRKICEIKGSKEITIDEMKNLAKDLNMQVDDFEIFVDKLNTEGTILMKGMGKYQLH